MSLSPYSIIIFCQVENLRIKLSLNMPIAGLMLLETMFSCQVSLAWILLHKNKLFKWLAVCWHTIVLTVVTDGWFFISIVRRSN